MPTPMDAEEIAGDAAVNDRQLKMFVELSEQGSFAKAAAHLFVSAPALKGQLDRLEKDLGVRLFERDNRGLRLTAAGREFLPYARRALAEFEGEVERLRALDGAAAQTLRFGYNTDQINEGFYPDALLSYRRLHPEVKTVFSAAEDFDLDDHDLFLGVPGVRPGVLRHLLCTIPLYCLVLRSDPLSSCEAVPPTALTGYRVSLPPRRMLELATSGDGASLAAVLRGVPVAEAAYRGMWCESTQSNILASCAPGALSVVIGREPSLPDLVCQVRLEGCRYPYYLYARDDASPTVQDYVEIVQGYYRRVIQPKYDELASGR